MAHRFIIDDQTGQLYKDFTGRRLTSAAEILKSERGLTPTLEFYLINVATDTGAVTAQTLTNAQLSVAIGSASTPPDSGFIKASFTQSGTLYESEQLNIESLTAASLESSFNSSIQPVYNVGGLTVDQIGPGKWLLTMKKVGAITGSPSLNVENSDPPSGVEVTSVTTGDSDTRAQWIISLSQLPVATIAGGSFSAVTSGSFSGLSSSIALNTTGMLAAIARNIKLFEFSVIHNNQVLHRSTIEINESLDPTAAGTVVVTSPSLFTLESNAVNQGETIALSGGLTYDGTTLAAPFLPLAGGTMTGDAVFNDNVKAKFGTDSDLEIYHTGSSSVIHDKGTGGLKIDSNYLQIRDGNQSETLAKFTQNGAVELYYNNSKKFETTDTGATISGKLIVNGDLDVSGTTTTFNSTVVTVDDPVFTVGGDTAPVASDNKDRGIEFRYFRSGENAKVGFFGFDNSENAFTFLTDATNNSEVFSGTLGNLKVKTVYFADGTEASPSVRFNVDSDTGIFRPTANNLAFSTGGTEAARFDSSGRLGISTDNPSHKLNISVSDSDDGIVLQKAGSSNDLFKFSMDGTTDKAELFQYSQGNVIFAVRPGNFGYINTGQNFGIGTTSPSTILEISGSGAGAAGLDLSQGESSSISNRLFFTNATASEGIALYNLSGTLIFSTGAQPANTSGDARMNLNSTGLGIGGTPSYPLVVKSTSATHQVVAVNRPDSDTAALFLGNNSGLNGIISANNSDLLFGKDFGNTFFEGFRLDTNGHLRVGNGTNIFLWRDNNNNYINYANWVASTGSELTVQNNGSGGIHLKANGANADVIFSAKDGTTLNELMRLDGSASSINVPDNITFKVGTGGLGIFHNDNNETWNYYSSASGTAIFSHAANDQDFVFKTTTGGTTSEVLRLDGSTGNVGIGGVTSPSAKLEISDFVSGEFGALRLSNTNTGVGDNVALEFKAAGLGSPAQIVGIAPGGLDVDLAFLTVDSNTRAEVMRITGNGNVGINETAPSLLSASTKGIHITGTNAQTKIESDNNGGWAFTEYKSPQGSWTTGIGDDDKYYITNSTSLTTNPSFVIDDTNQKVGIGTTNPGTLVQLSGGDISIQGADGESRWFGFTSSVSAETYVAKIECDHDANWGGNLKFFTGPSGGGNAERMRITGSGKVGLGTLSVNAGIGLQVANGGLYVTSGDVYVHDIRADYFSAATNLKLVSGGSANILFKVGDTNEVARFNSSGQLGIGTTPTKTLHVNSGLTDEVAIFESSDGAAYISIQDSNTSHSLQGVGSVGNNLTLYANQAEMVRVKSNGDVEIKTDGQGLILNSADGTPYRITVANDGTVTSTAV